MADEARELKCLVLPLRGTPALVPNSSVAEIVTQQDVTPGRDKPDWYLGTGSWRGIEVPLIAFDRLCGERQDVPAAAGRFVVMFGLSGDNGAPSFYGIRIESLPRTETVDAERLQATPGATDHSQYVRVRATLGERECVVPDFDAIGHALARYAGG